MLAKRVINSVLACVCEVGYYDDAVNANCANCNSAPYFCQSCFLSTCLTCPSGANRILVNRYCACNFGFYALGSNCIPCHSSCSACSSYTANSCLSCNSGRFLSGTECICSPGQILVGANCQDCHPSCLTCSGPSETNCVSCDLQENRVTNIADNSCPCVAGFYHAGTGACQKCQRECLTCEGTAARCLSCPPNTNRISSSPTGCPCATNFYSPPFTVNCTRCSITC